MSGEKCDVAVISASFNVSLEDLQRMREQAAQLRNMSSVNLQVIGEMLNEPNPKSVYMLRGMVQCMINVQLLLNGMEAEIDKMTNTILAACPPRRD